MARWKFTLTRRWTGGGLAGQVVTLSVGAGEDTAGQIYFDKIFHKEIMADLDVENVNGCI